MSKEFDLHLINEYLVPLIAGVKQAELIESTTNEGIIAYSGINKIKLKLRTTDTYAFILQRSQKFDPQEEGILNEFSIVAAFVDVMSEMREVLPQWHRQLRESIFIRMISSTLSNSNKLRYNTLISIIDQLDKWSRGTYEGRQHSAAVIVSAKKGEGVLLRDVISEPYYSVLSNGYDTAIQCADDGRLIGHVVIEPDFEPEVFAPYRLMPIAKHTADGDIGLVLNRKGDILIFSNKNLCFARRCGRWHFLMHDPVIKQIYYPFTRKVRESIYKTCLDVSFAGTGACLGVVLKSKINMLNSIIANTNDLLTNQATDKAKSLNTIVAGKKFQDLHRLIRMELTAIDGALLMDEDGNILSVGTILNIKSGSPSGGRLAAAMTLAQLGLGVKVSQDGTIQGFLAKSSHENPAFSLM